MVGVLVLGLLAAGCGGGDDNGSSGTTSAEGTAANTESNASNPENGAAEEGESPESSESSEGGESSESGESPEGGGNAESTEKTEFTAKANAICLKTNLKAFAEVAHAYKKAEAEGVDTEPEGRKLEKEVILPILVDAAEAQDKGIGSLEAPSGDEQQVQAILSAYQKWIDEAKADPEKTARAGETFAEARELAGKYPLVKCGLGPFEIS